MILDGGNTLTPDVQLYLNGASRVSGDTISEADLKDGDRITFMMPVAGG